MKFINTIVFCRDLQESKRFYRDVLGLDIVQEMDTIVFFENHFVIHAAREQQTSVYGTPPDIETGLQGRDNLLIYFEHDDLDAVFTLVKDQVNLFHPIITQPWGQRVFRFHDPDGHIVEVGEPM